MCSRSAVLRFRVAETFHNRSTVVLLLRPLQLWRVSYIAAWIDRRSKETHMQMPTLLSIYPLWAAGFHLGRFVGRGGGGYLASRINQRRMVVDMSRLVELLHHEVRVSFGSVSAGTLSYPRFLCGAGGLHVVVGYIAHLLLVYMCVLHTTITTAACL